MIHLQVQLKDQTGLAQLKLTEGGVPGTFQPIIATIGCCSIKERARKQLLECST